MITAGTSCITCCTAEHVVSRVAAMLECFMPRYANSQATRPRAAGMRLQGRCSWVQTASIQLLLRLTTTVSIYQVITEEPFMAYDQTNPKSNQPET
jgi:hypothetical protein